MNPQKKSITHQQAEEQQVSQHDQQTQPSSACEFASVEEMLRRDARDTPVPPAIVRRLEQSVSQLPPSPKRRWWRRILGGPHP
jgi:hypothetical protein